MNDLTVIDRNSLSLTAYLNIYSRSTVVFYLWGISAGTVDSRHV